MQRNIFEVYAKVVDANGAYNTLSGYPKVFDSRAYSGDIDKTLRRATAEFCETAGASAMAMLVILYASTSEVFPAQSVSRK